MWDNLTKWKVQFRILWFVLFSKVSLQYCSMLTSLFWLRGGRELLLFIKSGIGILSIQLKNRQYRKCGRLVEGLMYEIRLWIYWGTVFWKTFCTVVLFNAYDPNALNIIPGISCREISYPEMIVLWLQWLLMQLYIGWLYSVRKRFN